MKRTLWIILLLVIPHFAIGQYIKAKTYSEVTIDEEFIKDTLTIDAYLTKAVQYSFSKDKYAQLFFKKAIEKATILASQEQIAKVFLVKGIYYWKNYEYFEAIKTFNKALIFYENSKDSKNLSKLNYYLAESYYYVYSEDIAFKYFLRALNSYRKDNNDIGVAFCYNGIGTIYGNKNDKVALGYLNKALAIFLKYKNYKGISSSYINIANVTADNNEIEKGIELYNKSIASLKYKQDEYNLAINYNNLGDCYIHLKDYNRALLFFEKSLAISEKMDVKILHALIYLNIAEAKFKQGFYNEAITFSNKSINYAKIHGDMEIQALNVLALSNIYEKTGKHAKALQLKNEYIVINERSFRNIDQKKIQLFQSLNELENSQFEINKLKLKNESVYSKLQTRRNITYLLIFITLVLISLIIFLFYQQKEKNKIYALLKTKSDQINTLKDDVQVQNDYLSDLNNTKNKLFKIIAHDLKNPLSSIEAFTDMMLQNDDEYDEEEHVIFLNVIKESATKASEILNDVLVWAIDQEKPLKNKKLSLYKLINEELKLLEIQALQKEISIENQVASDLNVVTDKNKVATIIRNLISNAIKFSFVKGGITIQAEEVGKFVKITVNDNGIGIATADLHNLFIVDYKKSKLGTSHEEGTGLGLVLCKDFVEKLGGRITVSSKPDHGSSFSFTIPITNTIPD